MGEAKTLLWTPGPWRFIGGGRYGFIAAGPDNGSLADVLANSHLGRALPLKANGYLIASAPALYGALDRVVESFHSYLQSDYETPSNPNPGDKDPAIILARAALLKAREG